MLLQIIDFKFTCELFLQSKLQAKLLAVDNAAMTAAWAAGAGHNQANHSDSSDDEPPIMVCDSSDSSGDSEADDDQVALTLTMQLFSLIIINCSRVVT